MVAQLGGQLYRIAVLDVGGTQGMSLKVAVNLSVGHHAVEIEDESGDGAQYFVGVAHFLWF